jgi:predicted ArsR family transcriptional regulator
MQHTRQHIIDYLQENRTTTSKELSHVLLLTAANVRHHLRVLEDTGMVEVVDHEPGRGRGRPSKIYSLTEKSLRHNLAGLVRAILKALSTTNLDLETTFATTAEHLIGEYQAANSIHTRLNQAVEKLNQMNYQSSWEASPSGPRVILRNCPYALIISDHPELCQLDAALLKRLLNQPVEQTAKLQRGSDGSPYCAFILSTK